MQKIAVLGAGSWGNTLAILLCKRFDVAMWEFNPEAAKTLNSDRENKIFLKGIKFPNNLFVTNNLKEAIDGSFMVVFAVPSFAIRSLSEEAKDLINEDQILVSVIKGLEDNTFLRMSEIIDTIIPKKRGVVALSGPTHAEEVARGIPTTIVAACKDLNIAAEVQRTFMADNFRVYTNDDIIGVEISAAAKNVIAIVAGISDGIGFGDNTKAAIITRGLAEIIRLGKKIGAKEKTFSGLAGIGDLIVTCQSHHSRNRHVGEELGRGKSIDEILSGMTMVAEGVKNCKSLYHYAGKLDVEMPFTESTYNIIYEKASVKDEIKNLLGRKEKYEHWE